ncbi:MAG: hypothetical protein ACI9YE_003025 [Psychroserpens sp.]|jgi:hypothetical protein
MEFLKAIFLVIVAASSAFLFNFFLLRLQAKSKSILSTASTLLEYLEQIENESVNYWSKNFSINLDKETSKKILEIKIKSLLKITRQILRELLAKDLESIMHSEKFHLSNFSSDIFDLVTGSSFEDEDFDKDLVKCAKISNSINSVKVITLKIINNNR